MLLPRGIPSARLKTLRFPCENTGLTRTGPQAGGDERVSMMRELPARALYSTLMFILQEEGRESGAVR